MEDVKIFRLFLDAQELMIDVKLRKLRKKISLNEVIQAIEENLEEYEDTTSLIRTMRERAYDT